MTQNISAFQLSKFDEVFRQSSSKSKTLGLIQQQFIQKYRYKNGLVDSQDVKTNKFTDQKFKQFVYAFKDTFMNVFDHYQYIQNILEKFSFCKDLKKLIKAVNSSQQKVVNFFVNEVEFHKGFIQENQFKYKQKITNIDTLCINCKQNNQTKLLENLYSKIHCQFNDPFKLYDHPEGNLMNRNVFTVQHARLNRNQPNNFPQSSQDDLIISQQKMYKLLNQSKKLRLNSTIEQTSQYQKNSTSNQQSQFGSINQVKVNQMFFDLQNDMNKRSSQLQEYLDEIMGFNDKLLNTGGNHNNNKQQQINKSVETVDNQLRSNFNQLFIKMYKKIQQVYKKRKQQAISIETQANFNDNSILQDLQKNVNKLSIELRQCQFDKVTQISNLKEQIDTLNVDINAIAKEKLSIEISKDQILVDREIYKKQCEKLVKTTDQCKLQIERLESLLDKEKKYSLELRNQNKQIQKKMNLFKDLSKNKGKTTHHTKGGNQQEKYYESINNKQKSPQQQLAELLQRKQLDILKNMAMKRSVQKKKFLAPRRSKLAETVNVEDSPLVQTVSRFSKNISSEDLDQLSVQRSKRSGQSQHSQNQDKQQHMQQHQGQEQQINRESQQNRYQEKNKTSEKNGISEQKQRKVRKSGLKANTLLIQTHNINNISRQKRNNNNSKSFKVLSKHLNQFNKFISSKIIDESEQQIKRQFKQLQNIHQMNEIEKKLKKKQNNKQNARNSVSNKFNIKRQINECFTVPKKGSMLKVLAQDTNFQNSCKKISNHVIISEKKNPLDKQQRKSNVKKTQSKINHNKSTRIQQPHKDNSKRTNQFIGTNLSIKIPHIMENFSSNNIDIQDNNIGIQTRINFNYNSTLNFIYQYQIKLRNWNNSQINFDLFKYVYEQAMNRICEYIQLQDKQRQFSNSKNNMNMIGSSKQQNYKNNISLKSTLLTSGLLKKKINQFGFNKENNILNKTLMDKSDKNCGAQLNHSLDDDKKYYFPKFTINKIHSKLNFNKTSMNKFQLRQDSVNSHEMDLTSINDLKNVKLYYQNLDENYQKQTQENQDDKKILPQTVYQERKPVRICLTDENYQKDQDQQLLKYKENKFDRKLPVLKEKPVILQYPSFLKNDVESLFFSLTNAQFYQQKIINNLQQKNSLLNLQKDEIRFSTQLFTILANIHLIQQQSYMRIKNIFACPVKIISGYNCLDQVPEIDLKKSVAYILQIHRKCKKPINVKGSKNSICPHLIAFRKKITQIITVHNTNKMNMNNY